MIDFAVAVEQWTKKAGGLAMQAFQATATDAVTRVKELTPVDTGYLRSNWVDVAKIDASLKPSQNPVIGEAIRNWKPGEVLFIVNPVVYARRIEYGFVGEDGRGRSYNQVGRGMMRQTIAEMPSIAERAVKRVRGR